MANWWDSIPDTPAQTKKNWWDEIPDPDSEKPASGFWDTAKDVGETVLSKLNPVTNLYSTVAGEGDYDKAVRESAIAGAERGARGIGQAAIGALPWYIDKEPFAEVMFNETEKLRKDEEARRKNIPQSTMGEVGSLAGGVIGGLTTLGAGEAGALGEDVINAGGTTDQAVKATLASGAVNALATGAGGLASSRLGSAAVNAIANPIAGGINQAVLNEVAPESMHGDVFDPKARLKEALIGGVTGFALGGGAKEKAKTDEVPIIKTGDADIDAGQEAALSIKKPEAVEEAPSKETSKDMFSGEEVPASRVEAARAVQPERTVEQLAALEQEYRAKQQGLLNLKEQGETFEPARVPTVEQAVEQPSLLPQEEVPVVKTQQAETNLAERLAKANEESIKTTGKPLQGEALARWKNNQVADTVSVPKGTPDLSPRAETITRQVTSLPTKGYSNSLLTSLKEGKSTVGEWLRSVSEDAENHLANAPQPKAFATFMRQIADRMDANGVRVERSNWENPEHKALFEKQPHVAPGRALALYDPRSDRIIVHSDEPSLPTMLHEITHALTQRANIKGKHRLLPGESQRWYDTLSTAFEELKKNTPEMQKLREDGSHDIYGATNLDEFLAELYGKASFRNTLKKMPVEALGVKGLPRLAAAKIKNAFQFITTAVRGMLGLPEKAQSALDGMLAASERYMNTLGPEERQLPSREYMQNFRAAAEEKRPERIQEDRRGKLLEGAAKWSSWKGGRKLALEKEGTENASRGASYVAEKSTAMFDKAGYNKLTDTQKAEVRKATEGDKTALANLSPAMKAAVEFTRDKVEQYQLRLAATHPKLDGNDLSKMIYDSVLKGDWLTKTYAVNYMPKTMGFRMMEMLRKPDKPFWRWYQEKYDPESYKAGETFAKENLVIPDKISDRKAQMLGEQFDLPEASKVNPDPKILRDQIAEQRKLMGETPEKQLDYIMDMLSEPHSDKSAASNIRITKQFARDDGILQKRTLTDENLRKFWGETKDARLNAGFSLVKIGNLVAKMEGLKSILDNYAGKEIFDSPTGSKEHSFKIPENDDYGALAGKYTSKKIHDEVTSMVGMEKKVPDKVMAEIGKALWKSYVQAGGALKLSKTALSVVGFMRNAISSGSMITNFATRLALSSKNPITGFRDVLSEIGKVAKDFDAKQELVEHGLMSGSVGYGEIKKAITRIQREVSVQSEKNPAARAIKQAGFQTHRALNAIIDLYGIPDDGPRVLAYLTEKAVLKQQHPEMSPREIAERAADYAKNVSPTYARASPSVRAVSQVMANFGTWAGEVVRTTGHQLNYGGQALARGEIRNGIGQLAGAAAQMTTMTLAANILTSFFGNTKNKQEGKEDVEALAPDYAKGENLFLLNSDEKTKKLLFLDASRIDPSGPVVDIGRELSKHPSEPVREIWKWMQNNWLNPGPILQAGKEAVTGENKYGKKQSPERTLRDVVRTVTPETINTIISSYERAGRGVPTEFIVARLAGAPIYEISADDAAKGKLYDLKTKLDDSNQILRSSLSDPKVDNSTIEKRYADYLHASKEEVDKAAAAVKAAKRSGKMSNSEIDELIKEVKLDKDLRDPVRTGKFTPDNVDTLQKYIEAAKERAIKHNPNKKEEYTKLFNERERLLGKLRREWKTLMGT